MAKDKLLIFVLSLFLSSAAIAQSNPSTWVELGFSKKIVKNLKLEFNPELRLFGGFEMDSYILTGGLSYKVHDYLTLAGYYRFKNEYNYREKRDIYDWEPANRLAFDAKTGVELRRFDFQFRLRYTNEDKTDQEWNDQNFRYRGKIDYDVRGSKFIPFVSVEVFHNIIDNYLDEVRYIGGLAYPLNNDNEISLFYCLRDFLQDPNEVLPDRKESMHIIGIGYSLKF